MAEAITGPALGLAVAPHAGRQRSSLGASTSAAGRCQAEPRGSSCGSAARLRAEASLRVRATAQSGATLNQGVAMLKGFSRGLAPWTPRRWAEGEGQDEWTLFTSDDFAGDDLSVVPVPVEEAAPQALPQAAVQASFQAVPQAVPQAASQAAPVQQAASTRAQPRVQQPRQFSDESWIEHEIETACSRGTDAGVPVYIMLPLDTVTMANSISRPRAIRASLAALKSAGVEGVMMDVWWGIVERAGPGQYDWSAYKELVVLVQEAGLKVQMVMSFHQCGGNVGDHCLIPLPPWVHEAIDNDGDIVYTDKSGRRNREYLSLSVDDLPVLRGRTPIQAYSDFMRSFRDNFKDYLGSVITEIQVGMGPAGELRYPSYPEGNNLWRFPGIGEFQCYDKYMLAHLGAAAEAHGMPSWGYGGPHDSGCYKQWPQETGFFHENGNWRTPYGQFFLQWYSDMLLLHGNRVLSAASGVFRESSIQISGKVAGIHWHYGTQSHPAELTAGYYNTIMRDGYLPIARMFGRHGAILNFTCIEMKDTEQPWYALCSPEGLLRQVAHAARVAGIRVSGENALPRFDAEAFSQIVRKSRLQLDGVTMNDPMSSFTFLRMNEHLFRPENWRHFVLFVKHMREGRSFAHDHQCGQARDWVQAQLHATGSLSQAAAELLLQ